MENLKTNQKSLKKKKEAKMENLALVKQRD